MNCKEFEKQIPDFIADKLNFMQLQEFTAHAENCPLCKEELVISFLIDKGLARLEEGNAFDLQKEINIRMREAQGKIAFHERFLQMEKVFGGIMMLAVLGVVCAIIFI